MPADPALEKALAAVKPHPRIILSSSDVTRIRSIAADPSRATAHRRILRNAEGSLSAALPSWGSGATSSGRLMAVGRTSADRILAWGYAGIVTGDTSYTDRIRSEVAALSGMRNWAPDHLLSTSEIASAVAAGYSLSYGRMGATERSRTTAALVSKALAPASCLWARGDWRVTATHNWGTVANTGLALAALVVTDSNRPLAAAALRKALTGANGSLGKLAADGGSQEGPGYTGYVHYFAAYLSSSMTGALGRAGDDLVVDVRDASRYSVAITGPSGETFNFADSDTRPVTPLLAAWNGRTHGDGLGAWLTRTTVDAGHSHPMLTVWDAGPGTPPHAAAATSSSFTTTGVASLRGGWGKYDAFVAVKGGWNGANHSHLDIGSFVLDLGGVRFVGDPGKDSYSLPGYLAAPQRFEYFRTSTSGHATVSLAGANQPTGAYGGVTTPTTTPSGEQRVSVDLRRALGSPNATRTVALAADGRAVVADRIWRADKTLLRWTAPTQASVTVARDGRSAVLERAGRTVRVTLGADTRGVLRVLPPPPAPEGGISTAGWSRLVVDVWTKGYPGHAGTYGAFTVTFDQI